MDTLTMKDTMILSKNGSAKEQIKLDFHTLKKGAMVLRAINHKLRQSMIDLLEKKQKTHSNRTLC